MTHERYYTIGMAGHIDHGKTALTKALTNIDTDRLKEEKERKISIEPGFAPLPLKDSDLKVSVIDVPGHEKFIRQMIAGVAGIDLVLLVIAADEGIMPQTKEHFEILSLLEVQHAIFVITKIDKSDQEMIQLIEEDIADFVKGTSYEGSPVIKVDSLSGKGISQLQVLIEQTLQPLPHRGSDGSFRMPIDQVFSLKGIGTVVRGTVYEGMVKQEDDLYILPKNYRVRARQIQVHKQNVSEAYAGQRAAINITGLSHQDIKRGDVLVKSRHHFVITRTIDVSLRLTQNIQYPVKQRTPVKLHTATSEVLGKIVFFDRNDTQNDQEEILCQLRLEEAVVVNRGDRFILRRATPVETIGGGWIINPKGQKYKFGKQTIDMLKQKKEGSPEEQIVQLLKQKRCLTDQDFIQQLSIAPSELEHYLAELLKKDEVHIMNNCYLLAETMHDMEEDILNRLHQYHEQFPMRPGINKPELLQSMKLPDRVMDGILDLEIKKEKIKREGQYVSLFNFIPHFPSNWQARFERARNHLKEDGLTVKEWKEYLEEEGIPESLFQDFKQYMIHTSQAFELTEKYMIDTEVFFLSLSRLYQHTDRRFHLKEAKDIWNVSRKYLIPLLELTDQLKYTKRMDQEREWLKQPD
ncbi:MAG: selenocysteine-specific translation elongation factor [Bacillaceae bacterium]|nr:selenocysteine-specific translation elongation factor [Bacillaceae bacterium]